MIITLLPGNRITLRLHGMSWGVKTTCFKAPGVSLGGSGVSIGGVRSLRVSHIFYLENGIGQELESEVEKKSEV